MVREELRPIIREEVGNDVALQLQPVNQRLDKLSGDVQALSNDVKELYAVV